MGLMQSNFVDMLNYHYAMLPSIESKEMHVHDRMLRIKKFVSVPEK